MQADPPELGNEDPLFLSLTAGAHKAATDPGEWSGEPHTLIVRAVHLPHGPLDDGCLDYEIEHPPSCREETIGKGENAYTQYACDVAWHERESDLPFSLRYSGTPITKPGTYRIQGWGRKTWYHDWGAYEYDGGVGLMDLEEAATG